jgi:hypothetical protein
MCIDSSLRNYKQRRAKYIELNTEAGFHNCCCCRKSISITYPERVFVDVSMQHAMHMRHIAICGPSASTVFFTSSLVNNTIVKEKNVIEYIMRVLFFSTNFVGNISHSKKKWPRYNQIYIYRSSYKLPVILDRYQWNLKFLKFFCKIHKRKILWKSDQWEPRCSMQTDEQTDRHNEANSRLSQVCEQA